MIITPSYSFARASGTTQYTAADLIANHGTAANVVPLSWSLGRLSGNGLIRGARFYKSGTTATAAKFALHLFSSAPGTPSNGDNGAFGIASAANYIDEIAVDMSTGGSPGTAYLFKRVSGLAIGVDCGGRDRVLYGLLEATDAYTPVSEEVFKVILEIERNS